MSDLSIYLDTVLHALKKDIAPAVTTDRARKAVDAISQIVASSQNICCGSNRIERVVPAPSDFRGTRRAGSNG